MAQSHRLAWLIEQTGVNLRATGVFTEILHFQAVQRLSPDSVLGVHINILLGTRPRTTALQDFCKKKRMDWAKSLYESQFSNTSSRMSAK